VGASLPLILAASYFLPTLVALLRWKGPLRTTHVLLFGVFNLSIAWTGIGWVTCMFLAFSKRLANCGSGFVRRSRRRL
jgi:hypothetical protein